MSPLLQGHTPWKQEHCIPKSTAGSCANSEVDLLGKDRFTCVPFMVTAAPGKVYGERAEEVKQSPREDNDVIEIEEHNDHLGSVTDSCREKRDSEQRAHSLTINKIIKLDSAVSKIGPDVVDYNERAALIYTGRTVQKVYVTALCSCCCA